MESNTRAAGLTLFTYVPPFWSIGDRLVLGLDFLDEETMRRALAPVGLEHLADWKIGGDGVELAGVGLYADVFGPSVTLTIYPEDRYELLEASHFEGAARVERALRDAGLHGVVGPPRADDDVVIDKPAPRRPVPRRTAHTWLVWLDRLDGLDGADGRFVAHPIVRLVVRHAQTFDVLHVTDETACIEHDTAVAVSAAGLRRGLLAVADMTVSRRHDGTMGAVAARLAILRPTAERRAEVGRVLASLARAGIDVDRTWPFPAIAAARVPREGSLADDVAVELEARALEPGGTLEELLDGHLIKALHGWSEARCASLGSVLAGFLLMLQTQRLPCLFSAAAALREAVAACGRGADARAVRGELFARTLREAERSFERTGDARRYWPVRLRSRPDEVTFLVLTADAHRSLVADGLVLSTS